MTATRRFATLLLLSPFGAGSIPVPSSAAQDTPPASAAVRIAGPDSLDDGPHVYWQDGTHAIVLYVCHGEVATTRLDVTDTLAFRGRCADSTVQYRVPTRPSVADADAWRGVPRVLAVSDIHGEYEALVAFLTHAGVIDTALNWRWGEGHLVVVGDVFDRGGRVTECLWLLYRLEREAERAGGRVHVLLGNHEMMVIRDDLRYVNPRYLNGIVRLSRIRYPDLFGPEMELGRWLRRKPVAVKINDVLYVHGGIAPELVARGLDLPALNRIARESLDLPSSTLAFSEVPRLLFGSGGPLWYRGYHGGDDDRYNLVTADDMDTVLRFYGVTAVVVGHSEIPQVASLHGGRVFGIDVPVETLGGLQGLLWADGRFARVTGTGALEPLRGGVSAPAPQAAAGRAIALTFDDLPATRAAHLADTRDVTARLLAHLGRHQIPSIGFVNEVKLDVPGEEAARRALLEAWLDAGHDLGNHTYSHVRLYDTPLAAYQADVLRGEQVTRALMAARGRPLRYFRHPTLNTGPDLPTKRAFERFLADHGYVVAPVTIDNDEFLYAAAYDRARARGDQARMDSVGHDYVRYMTDTFGFYEGLSRQVLGREIPQVLLLHANALNAEYLDELIVELKGRGYRFVSLDDALADSAYQLPDEYVGPRGPSWIHRWAVTRGQVPDEQPAVPDWVARLARRP